MRSTILLTTIVATTFASPHPFVEIVQVREVAARQDMSSFDINTLFPTACQVPTNILSLELAAPTLPADVASVYATWSDPCHTPKLTGSLSSEYASYTDALSAYVKSAEPILESWGSYYMTACPLAASETLSLETALPTSLYASLYSSLGLSSYSCAASSKSGASATGSAGAASGTGSAGATGTAGGASQAKSTGAAPQQTAFAAVAGIVAGFAGIVVAL